MQLEVYYFIVLALTVVTVRSITQNGNNYFISLLTT